LILLIILVLKYYWNLIDFRVKGMLKEDSSDSTALNKSKGVRVNKKNNYLFKNQINFHNKDKVKDIEIRCKVLTVVRGLV
jgi:hypothetical protein